MLFYFVFLFSLCYAENLRGTVINNEKIKKDKVIQRYVYTYAMPIYNDILMKMTFQKVYNYSFIEFGCMPFTEDMKNTEIIFSKKTTKNKSIFRDTGIDYSFKVYSCYSHFLALSLFKKERNMLLNKNNYIPNNEKYNHFKFYYYEELEYYGINTTEIQEAMNEFLLEIFDDVTITHTYENCCRVYTLHW
jgi:hypothetical protein